MASHPMVRPAVGSWWRDFIEGVLPWYSPTAERLRNVRTESRLRRAAAASARGERIIADYRKADAEASEHGERLINETRRADDQ